MWETLARQNKIKIGILVALVDTSFAEKMAGLGCEGRYCNFHHLPQFWFPDKVISIHLQDSRMLIGMLRFLLEFL